MTILKMELFDGGSCLINLENVSAVMPKDTGCEVWFKGDQYNTIHLAANITELLAIMASGEPKAETAYTTTEWDPSGRIS